MAFYLDTSALVKLVVREAETNALRRWLRSRTELVSSDLTRTELVRATRRVAPDRITQARLVLDSITLIAADTETFEEAGRLQPALLPSLDAVHLATALTLGDDLAGFLTYDERLAEAVTQHGIEVVAPR